MKKGLIIILIAFTAMLMVYGPAHAKVKGLCVDCHTMHNSENNLPMAVTADTGWSGGALSGDPQAEPNPHLTKASCIGCHTNSGSETIVTAASGTGINRIPIVRNITEPVDPLAGGNFYYVDILGNNYGHNIMSEDEDNGGLSALGPGNDEYGEECAASCHYTLYNPERNGTAYTGCQGCHFETFHHKDPGAFDGGTFISGGTLQLRRTKGLDPTYRYLAGHHYWGEVSGGAVLTEPGVFVEGPGTTGGGIEDENWEQGISLTATDGNIYKAFDFAPWVINSTNRSVSAFCAACHKIFHQQQSSTFAGEVVWIRHPADQSMPTVGEYAGYTYNTEAPVAYTDTAAQTGPKVMCLSCHRPHGSPYENSLRWNYYTMEAGITNDSGCFRCHSEKDNP